MSGFNQRARVSGGDSVTDALRDYVAQAADVVAEAVQDEQEDFAARQQAEAEDDERWAPLASTLSTWEDEDGNFAHGVRGDDQAVAQAGMVEYGDETNAPSPFIRLGVVKARAGMSDRLTESFRRRGY
jgi:hypothetical protein